MKAVKGLANKGARVKHQISGKIGRADETKDTSYTTEYARFQNHYKVFKKLNKDLKKYFTILRELSAQHGAVTEDLSKIYESTELWDLCQKHSAAQVAIDQHRATLENQINEDVFMPLADYMGQFKLLDTRCGDRDKRRVDMDRFGLEVKRMTEKPPNDPSRLPAAQSKYDSARRYYEDLNAECIRDMTALYQDRVKFTTPVLATLGIVEHSYYQTSAKELTNFAQSVGNIDRKAIHRHPKVVAQESSVGQSQLSPRDASPPSGSYQQQPQHAPGSQGSGGYPQHQSSGGFQGGASFSGQQQQGGYQQQPQQGGYQQQPQQSNFQAQPHSQGFPQGGFGHQQQQQPQGFGHQQQGGFGQQQGGVSHQGGFGGHQGGSSLPPPPRPLSQSRTIAQALYQFQAQSPAELSFNTGDRITVLSQQGDWWQGELNGKQGLIPSNYVSILQ